MALFEMSSNMVVVMIISEAHRFRLVRRENDVNCWSRQSRHGSHVRCSAKLCQPSSLASLSAILQSFVVEELVDGNLSKHAVYATIYSSLCISLRE